MPINRPNSSQTLAKLEEAHEQVSALPPHLITPQLWAVAAMREALALTGTAEGTARAAECRRYLACHDALARMARRCVELEERLRAAGDRPV